MLCVAYTEQSQAGDIAVTETEGERKKGKEGGRVKPKRTCSKGRLRGKRPGERASWNRWGWFGGRRG